MLFCHPLRALRHLADDVGKVVGFRSLRDLSRHALGLYAVPLPWLRLEATAAITLTLADVTGFVGTWFWRPPILFAVLIALDLLNGYYGWRVAVRIKKEPFRLSEALRTGSKVAATAMVLFIMHSVVRGYAYAEPAAHLLFWWLFTVKFSKWGAKMAVLKVQEKGLPRLLQSAVGELLRSKFGPYLVDDAQGCHPAETSLFAQPVTPPTDPDRA